MLIVTLCAPSLASSTGYNNQQKLAKIANYAQAHDWERLLAVLVTVSHPLW